MPPQRTPLRTINANIIVKGAELSPYEHGKIVGQYEQGASCRKIEQQTSYSCKAISHAIRLDQLNTNGLSLPRSGRPCIYNHYDN